MICAMLVKCKTKENMFEMEASTGTLDSQWVIRRVEHLLNFWILHFGGIILFRAQNSRRVENWNSEPHLFPNCLVNRNFSNFPALFKFLTDFEENFPSPYSTLALYPPPAFFSWPRSLLYRRSASPMTTSQKWRHSVSDSHSQRV